MKMVYCLFIALMVLGSCKIKRRDNSNGNPISSQQGVEKPSSDGDDLPLRKPGQPRIAFDLQDPNLGLAGKIGRITVNVGREATPDLRRGIAFQSSDLYLKGRGVKYQRQGTNRYYGRVDEYFLDATNRATYRPNLSGHWIKPDGGPRYLDLGNDVHVLEAKGPGELLATSKADKKVFVILKTDGTALWSKREFYPKDLKRSDVAAAGFLTRNFDRPPKILFESTSAYRLNAISEVQMMDWLGRFADDASVINFEGKSFKKGDYDPIPSFAELQVTRDLSPEDAANPQRMVEAMGAEVSAVVHPPIPNGVQKGLEASDDLRVRVIDDNGTLQVERVVALPRDGDSLRRIADLKVPSSQRQALIELLEHRRGEVIEEISPGKGGGISIKVQGKWSEISLDDILHSKPTQSGWLVTMVTFGGLREYRGRTTGSRMGRELVPEDLAGTADGAYRISAPSAVVVKKRR